ncbi:MAG: helix-turn-helix transcriptional regulator [Salibacteraceae bacterium]
MALGQRIRKLRIQRNIDQKQFAFDCGVSRTQLHLIEKGAGNPRLGTLMKIAESFEMSFSELVSLDDHT